jgi:hypothetical protein
VQVVLAQQAVSMATPTQLGVPKTVRTPPLVPSRLPAVEVAEVGTIGRAFQEALAVAVAPPITQEPELQDKVTTVAPAVDSLAETMLVEVAVEVEVAESQVLQTMAATVAQVSLRQSLEPHCLMEAVAAAEFIQREAPQVLVVLASEVPAQLML